MYIHIAGRIRIWSAGGMIRFILLNFYRQQYTIFQLFFDVRHLVIDYYNRNINTAYLSNVFFSRRFVAMQLIRNINYGKITQLLTTGWLEFRRTYWNKRIPREIARAFKCIHVTRQLRTSCRVSSRFITVAIHWMGEYVNENANSPNELSFSERRVFQQSKYL